MDVSLAAMPSSLALADFTFAFQCRLSLPARHKLDPRARADQRTLQYKPCKKTVT